MGGGITGRTGTRIELTGDERAELERSVSSGKHPARSIRRAQVVLALDSSDGRKPVGQAEVADRFGASKATISNIKRDFGQRGSEGILTRKKRDTPPVPAKADGDFEAHLIALSCTEPPEGYSRWTVRLLAEKSVELDYIDSVSYSIVSRVLKKRAQAPLEQVLVHTANAKRLLRRSRGGYLGDICTSLRCDVSRRLHGRETTATARRGPQADFREAGKCLEDRQ